MNPRKLLKQGAHVLEWMEVMQELRPKFNQDQIKHLISSNYKLLDCNSGNSITGAGAYFATSSLQRGRYNYLADIVVKKEFRNSGLGTRLIKPLLASSLPCELDSGLEKIQAHNFYNKLGFISDRYAVRTKPGALSNINFKEADKSNIIHLFDPTNHDNHLEDIQQFLVSNMKTDNNSDLSVESFFIKNEKHKLLLLKNNIGIIKGILVYEQQYRLSVGGRCIYISDLIISNDGETQHHEQELILALVNSVSEKNNLSTSKQCLSIIMEMSEDAIKKHNINTVEQNMDSIRSNIDSTTLNLNSLFSVTAKHFIRNPGRKITHEIKV